MTSSWFDADALWQNQRTERLAVTAAGILASTVLHAMANAADDIPADTVAGDAAGSVVCAVAGAVADAAADAAAKVSADSLEVQAEDQWQQIAYLVGWAETRSIQRLLKLLCL